MTNAEIIQAIRNEIERLKGICTAQIKANPGQTFPFVMEMTGYDKILSFLDSLESEKPMNQDELEEEISKKYANDTTTMRTREQYAELARHFAEWGAEHLANSNDEVVINGHKVEYDKDKDAITMEEIPNGLEEAKEAYCEEHNDDCFDAIGDKCPHIRNAFIAGAKWDRSQMMQEAVEGEVCIPNVWVEHKEGKELVVRAEISKGLGFKFGDKVRVIVCKKED